MRRAFLLTEKGSIVNAHGKKSERNPIDLDKFIQDGGTIEQEIRISDKAILLIADDGT